MPASVIGAVILVCAFFQPLSSRLVRKPVSISVRKQDETWRLCLISHSMEKLGFEPRSVYSICYIPLSSKSM